MPFATIITLPSGTNVSKLVNLPLCNGWNGNVSFSIASSAQITVNSLSFKRDAAAGGIISRSVTSFTVLADRRNKQLLQMYESMALINYTCTQEVSVCIESKRGGMP